MEKEYSTLQACKILHLNRETLRAWLDKGLVIPSKRGKGKGTKSVFSREDLYRVFLFQCFCDAGFLQQRASEMAWRESFEAKSLRDKRYLHYPRMRVRGSIGGGGGDPHVEKIPSEIPGPKTVPYQWMMVVDLEAIKGYVDKQIQEQVG
jgi:hypothetical protein